MLRITTKKGSTFMLSLRSVIKKLSMLILVALHCILLILSTKKIW